MYKTLQITLFSLSRFAVDKKKKIIMAITNGFLCYTQTQKFIHITVTKVYQQLLIRETYLGPHDIKDGVPYDTNQ